MLIGDILDVFRKGKCVADPVLWKNIGVTTGTVSGLITSALAVSAGFGYTVDVADDVVQSLAAGIAGVLCLVSTGLHITTSDKIGLPPSSD